MSFFFLLSSSVNFNESKSFNFFSVVEAKVKTSILCGFKRIYEYNIPLCNSGYISNILINKTIQRLKIWLKNMTTIWAAFSFSILPFHCPCLKCLNKVFLMLFLNFNASCRTTRNKLSSTFLLCYHTDILAKNTILKTK